MGGQFCTDGPSAAMQPATLTINGLTEIEQTEQPETPVSGITGAAIDENGHLILTLSDGSTLDAGLVKGEDGAQGVGISNITYSENTLHIYLTDGTHYAFDLSGASGPDLPDNVTETSASCTEDGVRLTYAGRLQARAFGARSPSSARPVTPSRRASAPSAAARRQTTWRSPSTRTARATRSPSTPATPGIPSSFPIHIKGCPSRRSPTGATMMGRRPAVGRVQRPHRDRARRARRERRLCRHRRLCGLLGAYDCRKS